jgi:tRNA (guanine26-N2/guanine27-N2)-dimethyltransferase
VDIDPYGTPTPFVAAALSAVRPGGVMAVTATDMMVLAGVQKGACERRYGARPVRGRLSPEGGLRILLAYLEVRSASHPPAADPVGIVDPETWDGPSLGDRGPYGPMWLGPLFDPELVGVLAVPPTAARPTQTATFIERLREETGADYPFYYESNRLAGDLHLAAPPALLPLVASLRERGFRSARTHARPEGFRTDAPRPVVETVARALSEARQPQNDRVRA